jgi:hypothetical protein
MVAQFIGAQCSTCRPVESTFERFEPEETMKPAAAVLRSSDDTCVEEVELPSLADDEVHRKVITPVLLPDG